MDMVRDTLNIKSEVAIKRICDDELFGSNFTFKENENVTIVYSNEITYVKNDLNRTLKYQKINSRYYNPIKTSSKIGILLNAFIYPKTLRIHRELLRKNDTMVDGKSCYNIFIFNELERVGQRRSEFNLIIEKETFLPVIYSSKYFINDYNQFTFLKVSKIITEVNFDSIIQTTLKVEDYNSIEHDLYMDSVLNNNLIEKKINKIKGSLFNFSQIDSINFNNNLTLLDFWFVGCNACKVASDTLNKIYEKYKFAKNFQIVGVDYTDNSKKGKDKLVKYLKANKNYYSTMLIDESAIEKLNIHAFPTLILIDESSKVIWQSIGNNPQNYVDLQKILEIKLGKENYDK